MKVNVLFILGMMALLVGCKSDYDAPCRDQIVKVTNSFSTEQQAVIPYGSSDTLLFISGSGDSIHLLTKLYTDGFTYLPSIIAGNPECPADIDAYQMIQCNLLDSVRPFSIQYIAKKEHDSCWYVVDGQKYGMPMTQIGNPNHAPFSDSIQLNQHTFYEVSTFYGLGGDSILLTPAEGIIYFVNGGKSYGLTSFNGK